jgi:putative glutamine amidotransferase
MRKPLIGIPCLEKSDEPGSAPLYGVRASYFHSLAAAGAVALGVPLTSDQNCLQEMYQRLDGVLLAGGEDVNPQRYGEPRHPKLGRVSDLRDEAELLIIKWCYRDNKPILGVCRGLQVMNVALGGSLYQDIYHQTGSAMHREAKQADPWQHLAHEVALQPGSVLFQVFGLPTLAVNSLHHQAIKVAAPGLQISAAAPDGIVEGIEAPAKKFFAAVQCHPEVLWQKNNPRWLELFRMLVASA